MTKPRDGMDTTTPSLAPTSLTLVRHVAVLAMVSRRASLTLRAGSLCLRVRLSIRRDHGPRSKSRTRDSTQEACSKVKVRRGRILGRSESAPCPSWLVRSAELTPSPTLWTPELYSVREPLVRPKRELFIPLVGAHGR